MTNQPYAPPQTPYTPGGDASGKVNPAAVGMIVAGVFGLLTVLIFAFYAYILTTNAGLVIEEMDAQQLEQIRQLGDPEKVMEYYGIGAAVWGVITFITSVLMTFAGFQMFRKRSYGLCVTASILAFIPCLQTCCFFGVPIGVWSLIVLMNSDVKQAFSQNK